MDQPQRTQSTQREEPRFWFRNLGFLGALGPNFWDRT